LKPRDAAEDHNYTREGSTKRFEEVRIGGTGEYAPSSQPRSLDQNRSLKTLAPKIVKNVDEEHGWNRQNHQTRNQNKHLYSPLWPRILTGRPFSQAVQI
jgi:hypothetical protein